MYLIKQNGAELARSEQVSYVKLQKNGKKALSDRRDFDLYLMNDTFYKKSEVDLFWTPEKLKTLDEEKAERIAQSKTDLAAYLEAHPLQWTDGKYYSITSEKQQWLTSKLFSASSAERAGKPYDLTWNDTGDVCTEWELTDLWELAYAIDARVTALVTYQQTKEKAMRDAETKEALDAIEVNYDEVE